MNKSPAILTLALVALAAQAGDTHSEKTIYPTDPYGRIQHDKPSLVLKQDGRIIQQDELGRSQPHKQQYAVKDKAVYHADFAGRIQHNKPSFEIQKDGRVIQRNSYRNRQPHEKQYVIKGDRVYEADDYGRPRYDKPGFKVEEMK